MKSVEEIKAEITLKILQGGLGWDYLSKLPKNDELRTFIYQFDPYYAYSYAYWVDKEPNDETRKSSIRDPFESYRYARFIDKCPREDTREAAYKHPRYKNWYIEEFGE